MGAGDTLPSHVIELCSCWRHSPELFDFLLHCPGSLGRIVPPQYQMLESAQTSELAARISASLLRFVSLNQIPIKVETLTVGA